MPIGLIGVKENLIYQEPVAVPGFTATNTRSGLVNRWRGSCALFAGHKGQGDKIKGDSRHPSYHCPARTTFSI
jgi:hypothetical protein